MRLAGWGRREGRLIVGCRCRLLRLLGSLRWRFCTLRAFRLWAGRFQFGVDRIGIDDHGGGLALNVVGRRTAVRLRADHQDRNGFGLVFRSREGDAESICRRNCHRAWCLAGLSRRRFCFSTNRQRLKLNRNSRRVGFKAAERRHRYRRASCKRKACCDDNDFTHTTPSINAAYRLVPRKP